MKKLRRGARPVASLETPWNRSLSLSLSQNFLHASYSCYDRRGHRWSLFVFDTTLSSEKGCTQGPISCYATTSHRNLKFLSKMSIAFSTSASIFQLAARDLLLDIAKSGRRIPITVGEGVQLYSRVYRLLLHSARCCVSSFPTFSCEKLVFQLTIFFSHASGQLIFFKWYFCIAHDFIFSWSRFAKYMFSHATFRHLVPRNGLWPQRQI